MHIESPDLPGFRFMLSPAEASDIGKMTDAIIPALDAYLHAYMAAQEHEDRQKELRAQIIKAELASPHRRLNMVAQIA
ncbi:MAG: hypothetical protein ACREHE_10470 [Rhizomicrobium sp.]